MYSGTSKASNVHLTFVVNRILTLQLNKMELVIMKLCPVPESFNTLPKLSSLAQCLFESLNCEFQRRWLLFLRFVSTENFTCKHVECIVV